MRFVMARFPLFEPLGSGDTVVDVSDQTCADGTASGFVFQDFQSASRRSCRAIAARGNETLWKDLVSRYAAGLVLEGECSAVPESL